MISFQEKEKLVKIVNHRFSPQNSELGRAGYCIITGYYHQKSLHEICSFYSVSEEDAKYWWSEFGFNSSMANNIKKRSSKKSEMFEFLKGNIGESLTPAEIAEACEISMPTMYNFINSNIGWFKKIKRGVYEIVDADEERKKEKSSRG